MHTVGISSLLKSTTGLQRTHVIIKQVLLLAGTQI